RPMSSRLLMLSVSEDRLSFGRRQKMKYHTTQSGASATGVLATIVLVTIVALIFATNIPSFLTSHDPGQPSLASAESRANETAVIMSLRRIHSAEVTYSLTNGGAYGTLLDLKAANLLDST